MNVSWNFAQVSKVGNSWNFQTPVMPNKCLTNHLVLIGHMRRWFFRIKRRIWKNDIQNKNLPSKIKMNHILSNFWRIKIFWLRNFIKVHNYFRVLTQVWPLMTSDRSWKNQIRIQQRNSNILRYIWPIFNNLKEEFYENENELLLKMNNNLWYL